VGITLYIHSRWLVTLITVLMTCSWHSSLTAEQSFRIESIQRRSFRLIYGCTSNYENKYHDYSHMSLSDRREFLCKRFFYSIKNSESCLNYKSRNSATVQGLRNPFYLVPDTQELIVARIHSSCTH